MWLDFIKTTVFSSKFKEDFPPQKPSTSVYPFHNSIFLFDVNVSLSNL